MNERVEWGEDTILVLLKLTQELLLAQWGEERRMGGGSDPSSNANWKEEEWREERHLWQRFGPGR
jgi:hypothetical protein